MRIYLICPVRMARGFTTQMSQEYVDKLEREGHEVFYPQRDAPQDDPTGYYIVESELDAIRNADEVHIIWNKDSKGSHFDLGAAMVLNKKLVLVTSLYEDGPEKTYEKVIRLKEANEIPN